MWRSQHLSYIIKTCTLYKLISSLGINAGTLVHNHDSVPVSKVHDFFGVRIVGSPVGIRSDPLDKVVISSHQRVIHSLASYLNSQQRQTVNYFRSHSTYTAAQKNVTIFTSESSCRPNPLKYAGLLLIRNEVFVHLIVLMPTGIRYTSSTFQVVESLIYKKNKCLNQPVFTFICFVVSTLK